ncbi:MAG: type IV secretory system conjugative DNA transfer family protein [Cyanobacteriota/Melainabacteria group bacterium]
MIAKFETTGLVAVKPNDMAELLTSTLERLGYQNIRYAKLRAEFTAVDKSRELIDTDYWQHHYRLRVSWKPSSEGSLVKVQIEEKEGSGTAAECKQRADEIISALQEDAEQAQEVSEWHEQTDIHGSARWADDEDLLEANLITPVIDSKRLLLTPYGNSLYLQLPEQSTYQHAIVCGRTGVGKSTGFIIPNLIERTGVSMIVTEATPGENEQGELYSLTSGFRAKAGQHIYSFNPSDLTSTRINPVDLVRMSSENQKTDAAEKLAALIITNASAEGARVDPTWDQSEKLLLTSLILHAASIDENFGHIGFIRWMLLSGIKEVLAMMKNSPSEQAQAEFRGWLNNTSENFRFGVISGLLTKLNPWLSDTVVTLTSATDLKLELLARQRFTFYLSVPSTRKSMQTVGSLVLNFLLDFLLSVQLKEPLAMLLDEFTNFGYIPGIAERLSLVRKRNIGMVLGFQNYMQLEKVYGFKNAEIILDQPSCQVYFRQKNMNEAIRLSRAIGKTTVEERRTQYDGRIHEQIVGRDLITADELTRLDKDTVIILTGNTHPIKAKKFKPGSYAEACRYEPPERPRHSISETIAMRNEVARKQQDKWEQFAPKNQPSKTAPVEPLNSNLNRDQQQIMGKIRETRQRSSEDIEQDLSPATEFFDLWDM